MTLTGSVLSDLLIVLIIFIFILHVYYQKLKHRWFVFDPLSFFWAGVFVIYIIEGISSYRDYVFYFGEDIVQLTLLWIFFGLIFLHFGYYLKMGKQLAMCAPQLPAVLSPNRLFGVSLILMTMGLLGWKLLFDTAGGFFAWVAVPRGGTDWENISGYADSLTGLLLVGISLLVLHVEMHRRKAWLRILAWLLLALLLLFFLYLGTRSRTIASVLVALMAWSLPKRRNPSLITLLPLFLVLLVVTNFQAQYRGHFRNLSFNLHEIDWREVPKSVLPRFMTSETLSQEPKLGSEFSMTAAVVRFVPDDVPYALGIEFLQFFTHPIPRAWWPDKRYPKNESWTPIHLKAGTSIYWVDYVKVPYLAGPAPGHVASWYYNGGALGLIIGGLLVGIFLRAARQLYDRAQENQSYLVIYFIIAPLGFNSAVSHPFDWVYTAPLMLVPVAILLYFSRNPRRIGQKKHNVALKNKLY